ncbi:hypothetical protein CPLU01_08109 [Colletotrichum plurivorum]|uniref:Uncharacterized protein n=1 Tax=Colletotrichum plurivorum TaxID=2175906 RepID=A0A8H6NE15_9PEZI|nr:hypothetical protein CPLU01_08109 [Colletotrichum plurivorum]
MATPPVTQSFQLTVVINTLEASPTVHNFTLSADASTFVADVTAAGRVILSAFPPANSQSTTASNSTAALASSSSKNNPSSPSHPSCASPTSPNCTPNVSPGLATGSAVGLAFGCLFAGALIALALGFFCLRRRQSFAKQTSFQRRLSSRGHGGNEVVPLAKPPSNSFAHVLEKLPAAITHTQFETEASQWDTNIKNYVANHADLAIDLSTARGQTLLLSEQLSTLAGHDAPWQRLLRDKSTRYNAMRMLIARIITTRVDPETAAETSLLPQNVLRAYQGIAAEEKQTSDMRNIWRAMTMNLMSTTYQTSTAASLAKSPAYPSIGETAKIIHHALAPLLLRHSESGSDSETQSLVDVVAKGTLLGLHMFEQSNPTKFFWKTDEVMRDRSSKELLIVFPGIKQRRMQSGSREPRHESVIVHPIRA